MAMGCRSTNKTVYSARYHLVWCPKYRRRVLVGRVEECLTELVAEVAGELGAEVVEVEVVPDRVRLLVGIPPTPTSAAGTTPKSAA
jgi:putative transposase